MLGNVCCALSPTYAAMAVCRTVTAFFVSPGGSLGGAVASEMFFRKQRGRCMGVWTVMITLGVPVAPLVFGFVALRVGYRWIYCTLVMVNAVHAVVYFFLGSETRYEPGTPRAPRFGLRRIDPRPLRWVDFVSPLALVARVCVAAAAVVYAMVLLWDSIMTTFEIPQIFPAKFGLNPQDVGLQNITMIVGTLVGEQLGGFASDKWMWRHPSSASSSATSARC